MDQSSEEELKSASSQSDIEPSHYQFTLRHLMLLVMLASVIAGLFRLLPYRPEYFWPYAIYFGVVGIFTLANVPQITAELLLMRRAAARNKEKAIAFAEDARLRKRAGEGK